MNGTTVFVARQARFETAHTNAISARLVAHQYLERLVEGEGDSR